MATTTPVAVRGIRSKQRVRDLGEVFTRPREVNAMLDLIPAEVWMNPLAKFLEPACGNGAFLGPVLRRKLVSLDIRLGTTTKHAHEFGTLCTVASVFGVDISADNVRDSRALMREIVLETLPEPSQQFLELLERILESTIVRGDMLAGDVVFADWMARAPGLFVVQRYRALHPYSPAVGEPEVVMFCADAGESKLAHEPATA